MRGLIKAELLKLATVRSTWLLGLAVVLTGVLPALGFLAPGAQVEVVNLGGTLPGVRLGGVELSALLVMLLAVLGTAGEFQHRTAVGTFLVTPQRLRVVAAKVPAFMIVGAVLAALAGVMALAVVFPVADARGFELSASAGEVVRALLASMGIGALFGALGVGIGGLLRNQTAAALTALGWFLVLESLIPLALGDSLTEWLPGTAAAGIAGAFEMTVAVGFAVLATWAAAMALAATGAIARRDVA